MRPQPRLLVYTVPRRARTRECGRRRCHTRRVQRHHDRRRSALDLTGISSTVNRYLCGSPGCRTPTPMTCRASFSPRELVMATITQYSQGPCAEGTATVPSTFSAEIRSCSGSASPELKRRWCWQAGQIFALSSTVALQCGQVRVAPALPGLTALMLSGRRWPGPGRASRPSRRPSRIGRCHACATPQRQ